MKHTQAQTEALEKAVLEALEDRRLMSTVSFTDGILTLQGNEDAANNLTVKQTGDTVWAIANGVVRSYQRSAVRDIRIVGGQQNDVVYIDSTVRAHVDAKAGNDTIITGDGHDTVYAGDGNDLVDTRGGNDLLILGEGNDRAYAGDGNDVIDGFGGNDTVSAGRGNDKIFGGDGDDVLDGKEGDDTLIAGRGADRLYGGSGTNTFDGKEGPDTVYSDSANDNVLNATAEDKLVTPTIDGNTGENPRNDDNTPPAPVPNKPAEEPKDEQTPAPVPTKPAEPSRDDASNTVEDNSGQPGAPTSVIRAISSTVPAGHAVHVHGVDSTLVSGTMLDAKYEWDFGDAGSRHNKLVGFNAAHVYDKAGTYTVTLRVTNKAGKTSVARMQVNVAASDRRMVYVDRNGNDAYNGSSQNSAVKTFARAMQLAGDDTEIRFRRGQTFEFTAGANLPYENLVIGAYGEGANPVLMRTGARNGGNVLAMSKDSRNVTIEGLTFDSIWNGDGSPDGMPHAIHAAGENITVLGNKFLNVGYAVNNNGYPRGVLVQDNTAPLASGLREYFSWVNGTDHVIIGNTVANSTRQHIVRVEDKFERVLIADNNFSNIKVGRSGDWADTAKTTVIFQRGKWGYVHGNTLTDGSAAFGPLGSTDVFRVDGNDGQIRHPDYKLERTEWVVFEENKVTNASVNVSHGSQNIAIRNNVLSMNDNVAISVQGYNSTFQRGVSNLYITNNTGLNAGAQGSFLALLGSAETVTLTGNLYVAPKMVTGSHRVAAVFVTDNDLSSFKVISNNVWPVPQTLGYAEGGYFYVWTSWSDSKGYLTPGEWEAHTQVQTDYYKNVTLPNNGYQYTGSGVTAGASIQ